MYPFCKIIIKNLCMGDVELVYVTGFVKRGLIHASDFTTLMRHNFICGSAMKL